MRKYYLFFLILIAVNFHAQLRLNNIADMYVIKLENVENYVINGLGFKQINFTKTAGSNDFEYYNGINSFAEVIYVKIQIPHKNTSKNIITVRAANETYIQYLKSEITSQAYEYVGEKELYSGYNVHLYFKNNTVIMITAKKNSNGFYEINMIEKLK